jgi:hypothetical protein
MIEDRVTGQKLSSQLADSAKLKDNITIDVTDKRFGAKGDGVVDDTTAINSAVTYALSLQKTFANLSDGSYTQISVPVIYFPQGDFIYNGTITSLNRICIRGAGKASTRIQLNNNNFFLEPSGMLHSLELRGITFSGGKGAIHHTYTSSNDRGNFIVEDNEFYKYTVCAIGSNSSDMPYWKIKSNRFYGTNTSIGISLPQVCDFGIVEENEFLFNKFHIKIKLLDHGYIAKNDFIRWGSGIGTTDIWIVPTTTGGRNTAIYNNKFGPENLGTGDYRILIAQEATSANDYCSNITPDLTNVDTVNKVNAFTITNNSFNGAPNMTAPIIYSMCMGVADMYFDNIVRSGMPSCIIDFPQEHTEWNRLNRNNYFRLKNGDEQSEQMMCPVSLKTGVGIMDDPHGYMESYLDVPQYFTGGQSHGSVRLLSHTDTYNGTISSGQKWGQQVDSLGDQNFYALQLQGNSNYQFTIPQSSVTPGMATWIEFDVQQAATQSLTFIYCEIISSLNSGNVGFKRLIKLNSKWTRVRFLWIPRPLTNGENYVLTFLAGDPVTNVKYYYNLGRISVYQSREPLPSGNIKSHSLQMDTVVQGISAIAGVGQLYFDGTSLKFMLPNGTIKTVTLT